MTSSLTDAMSKVVNVLTPFTSEERLRIVSASLMLLGEQGLPIGRSTAASTAGPADNASNPPSQMVGISPQASIWLGKNNLTRDALEQWFHFEQDKVTPLALPGNASARIQQAANTYLVQGLAAFLATGEASFADKEARALCTQFGCYDDNNHSKVLATFGNRITGSKTTGWKLTNPGLAAAAALVRG